MKAKSVFSCISLLAVLLMTASCSSEDDLITTGTEVNLTFTATLDQYIDSRAISDGSMVDVLTFVAYDQDGNEIAGLRQTGVPVTGGRATVNTRVVKGHRYTFAFWAQNSECQAYSFGEDMRTLKVNYDNMRANDESRDAFYAVNTDFAVEPVTEPFEKDVVLHRPFAQLNFGTTAQDMEEANKYAPSTGSHIKIQGGVCTSLNLLSGVAGDPQPVELEAGPFPAEALSVNGEEYFYLSMNYLLANNVRSEITGITMTTVMNRLDNDASYAITYESLPVQRNFRTNVVGWLITRKADFKVVIDSSFDGDLTYDYGASVWGGQSDIKEPELKNGTYTLTEASELSWFQDHAPVDGSTIRIENALNFNELELRPLLCGASNITVVADDDCAIRGLKVSGTGSAALFGDATGLTVRNLTIDRMTVTAAPDAQGNAVAGAIVARASGTTTLENVTVEGSSINGSCMVGGLVGTVTAGGHLVATGCRVASSTIENTDGGSRQGLAGGLVGYIASGATAQHVFTSCEVYNTVIKARMSDTSLTSGKLLGALEGNSDNDDVRINNCTVMVNIQGLDEAAAAQQSPYGADQLIGGNQQGHGHIFINNVETILN